MNTKMKGLFKGLRYISHIFDEEKEQEIQIGVPTDVKHVAHIGWDGPAVESPSWMKEFKGTGFQSAPLGTGDQAKDDAQVKWISQDSKRGQKAAAAAASSSLQPARNQLQQLPEVPKSSRRHAAGDQGNMTSTNESSMRRDSATKSRHSRRHQNRDTSDQNGSKPAYCSQESGLPDIPKKSRRKKSKESVGTGSTKYSRSKGNTTTSNGSTVSDPVPVLQSSTSQLTSSSSIIDQEEFKLENTERRLVSKD